MYPTDVAEFLGRELDRQCRCLIFSYIHHWGPTSRSSMGRARVELLYRCTPKAGQSAETLKRALEPIVDRVLCYVPIDVNPGYTTSIAENGKDVLIEVDLRHPS